MSHSIEESEVESFKCLLQDHLPILSNNLISLKEYLETADKLSKEETIGLVEKGLEEAKAIVKRLKYIRLDLRGE